MPHIRPYRPEDMAAVSEICMRAGHAGEDARPHYRDPEILPDVFARPFLVREPELAFVVDGDDGDVVGYILGTADTPAFVRWFRDTWLPPLAARYPRPDGPAAATAWDAMMANALHTPERMDRPELVAYPAHPHANLLPGYHRMGLGKRLVWTFLDAVRERGALAVHASYSKFNIRTRQFCKNMGFEPLVVDDPDPIRYVGRSTAHDQ